MKFRYLIIFLLPIILLSQIQKVDISVKGQASVFTAASAISSLDDFPSTIRYIPEITLQTKINDRLRIGLDAAAQLYTYAMGSEVDESGIEPYRFTVRLDRPEDQLRFGLQKINFGPGQMLRLLQWFDELDPRDPLAVSPGVWATMYRRYFYSGSDLRLWAVYDHQDPMRNYYDFRRSLNILAGAEILPGMSDKPLDIGGRLEMPSGSGTMALSYHSLDPLDNSGGIRENRFALDGRWDPSIGIWFETIMAKTEMPGLSNQLRTGFMLGFDYTFSLGDGLYTSLELQTQYMGIDKNNLDLTGNAGVLTFSYPLGLNDGLSAYFIVFDRPGIENEIEFTPFVGWRHTQGNWMLFCAAYDYPETQFVNESNPSPNGKGMQLYLAYNH